MRQGTAIRLQEGEQLQCKDVNVRGLSVILAVFSTANAKDELYETKWLVLPGRPAHVSFKQDMQAGRPGTIGSQHLDEEWIPFFILLIARMLNWNESCRKLSSFK